MSTDQSLRVSEIFDSVQGEGASAGKAAVFLRLAVCNLRCAWCDTKYTWDWSAYRYEDEVRTLGVAEVADRLAMSPDVHLIVTGGEPLLQQPALVKLFERAPSDRYVEIETNGTLAPLPELARRVDQWNVSPKLANSGESTDRRRSSGALRVLRDTGRAWLKLVVESGAEAAEIETTISELEWPKERVLLMPQATTRAALAERTPIALGLAKKLGVGVTPRLHVERWEGRRGV